MESWRWRCPDCGKRAVLVEHRTDGARFFTCEKKHKHPAPESDDAGASCEAPASETHGEGNNLTRDGESVTREAGRIPRDRTLWSIGDIVRELEVSRETVRKWRRASDRETKPFPAPFATPASGPVWWARDVRRWHADPARDARTRAHRHSAATRAGMARSGAVRARD